MAVAAMAPSAEIAALLFSVLFSFVLTLYVTSFALSFNVANDPPPPLSNGVLQPFRELGWWRWMYRLSPYTYLIEGLIGQALGRKPIVCSSVELVTLDPPSGQTCQGFLQTYINNAGGYVTNPSATSGCEFCAFATTDQFLGSSFNILYSHHWRNFGLFIAYIIFNITA
ncbi:hypothetical protein H0H87_009113, partial [Tephrocybe sp. NHM501043]